MIGPLLSGRLGQPVVIENRADGGTAIAELGNECRRGRLYAAVHQHADACHRAAGQQGFCLRSAERLHADRRGFLAAAGTPAGVVERIGREVNDAMASPELRQAMLKVGFEPAGGSPQDFATLMAEQTKFWSPIVKASGFQME